MPGRKNKQVCLCNSVSEKEILHVLKKGAKNMGEVQKFTLASTSCGKCKPEVEALVDHYLTSKPADIQQRFDW